MKQFGKMMLLALGFGILTVVLSYIPSRPAAAAGAAPVFVTNTGGSPVPVSYPTTPTVNVGTLPAISGSVSVSNFPNTQNVSFNGTAQPISFSNTSTTPLFVDTNGPAREAVSGNCNAQGTNASGVTSCTLVLVPAGKVLVVESLSIRVKISASKQIEDNGCSISANDVSGNATFNFFTPALVLQGSDGTLNYYTWGGPVTLYAGTAISCFLHSTDTSDAAASLLVSFGGHLVSP